MKLVLLRHGQTDYNANARIQGQVDIELNEIGREQARMARDTVAGLRPTRVISSDLSRAADTASAVTDLAVVCDPRLRERSFGPWEGLTRDEIEAGWPEEYQLWRGGGEPGLGIESKRECGERVAAGILDHVSELADDETLLVCSHGSAITNAIHILLGLNPDEVALVRGLDNARVAVLEKQETRRPGWRIVSYNL